MSNTLLALPKRTPKAPGLNALRFGFTSRVVCMPAEDLQAYKAFVLEWHEDLKPAGVRETFLCQSIADNAWRMNGYKATEANVLALVFSAREDKIITDHPEAQAALAIADGIHKKLTTLQQLSMAEQRTHKQFAAMSRELERLQEIRKAKEELDLEAAANLMQMHAENNPGPDALPYTPTTDGFVLQIDAITTFIDRQTRRRTSIKYGEKRLAAA